MGFEDIKKDYKLKPENEKHNLCKFEYSTDHGKNPLSFGLIVYDMADPRSQIRFDSGNGKKNVLKGGDTFIYNPVYSTGNYVCRFLIITEGNLWQEESLEIKVEEFDGNLIQNFSQTQAAGHVFEGTVGSGLDVTIIYSPRAETGTDTVNFAHSANMDEHNIRNKTKRGVAHHFYDNGGIFKGKLTIEASDKYPTETREFFVIVHKLTKQNESVRYYPPI